jgi:hypothetical protein
MTMESVKDAVTIDTVDVVAVAVAVSMVVVEVAWVIMTYVDEKEDDDG